MSGGGAGRRVALGVLVAATVVVTGCRAAEPARVPAVAASNAASGTVATAGPPAGSYVATPSAEVTKAVPAASRLEGKPKAKPLPKPAPRFVSVAIPSVCRQAARDQTSTVWTVYAPRVVPNGFARVEAAYSRDVVRIVYRKGSAVILFVEGQWTALGPEYEYHGTADWGTHQGRYADVAQFGWDVAGASARKAGTAVLYRGGKLLADYALYAQRVPGDDLREVAASMRVVK
jgi:hypothetical protein